MLEQNRKYIQVVNVVILHMNITEKMNQEPQSFSHSLLAKHTATLSWVTGLLKEHEVLQVNTEKRSNEIYEWTYKENNRKKLNWWMNECFVSYLTIRKHAPSRTAFILTSKSMGKLMPKLSVSVSASLMKPVHCLLMRPTECPSLPVICTRGQKNAHKLLYFLLVWKTQCKY